MTQPNSTAQPSKTPKRGFGWLTALTILLLGAFGVVDAEAHFTHYKYGETFSALCWYLIRRFPVMRAVFGAAIMVLFTHILFQIP